MDETTIRRLAVVEDNEEDAEVLVSLLRANIDVAIARAVARPPLGGGTADPWLVHRYESGEEFLSACAMALPDLVLLDLNMPGLDGFAVLEHLRSSPATRSLPVLVLTTSTNPRDVNAAYEAGANAYFRKPVDLEAFERLLSGIVELWLGGTVLPRPSRNRMRP